MRFPNLRSGEMENSPSVAHMSLARLLRVRKEPHGKPITDSSILKGVEVSEIGIVELWIKPRNPHCPCCLEDLCQLREQVSRQKGVSD